MESEPIAEVKKTFVIGVSLAAVAFLVLAAKNEVTGKFAEFFNSLGRKYGIEPNLLRAICKKESNFNQYAINVNPDNPNTPRNEFSRDIGLMQINEHTAEAYGISGNLFDVNVNIDTACRVLNDMKSQLGDKYSIFTLISAYNIGAARVKKDGIINVTYVSTVYYYYTLYNLA